MSCHDFSLSSCKMFLYLAGGDISFGFCLEKVFAEDNGKVRRLGMMSWFDRRWKCPQIVETVMRNLTSSTASVLLPRGPATLLLDRRLILAYQKENWCPWRNLSNSVVSSSPKYEPAFGVTHFIESELFAL